MGAFDDLIPSSETAKGAFDDLIPPPIKAIGAFDDLIPSHGATRSFTVTSKPAEPPPSFVGDVVMPTLDDLSGVITKAGAGLVKGGTLGVVDPERGKIGIPFTDVKFKYAPPLAESLESFGMTPELAENPYIGIGPQMIGLGKGWGEISSFLSKAIMARRAGQTAKSLITGAEALPKPLSAIERIGLQTGIGGAVGAAWPREKDESIIENTLSTAALGGGLQILGEGVAAIAKVTGIGKANAYQKLKQELSDIFYERAFSEKLGRTLSRAEADFAAGQAIDKGLASAGIEKPTWKDLWSAWRRVKGRRGMPPPKTEPPVSGEPTTGPVPPGPTEGPVPPEPSAGMLPPAGPEPQGPMLPSGIGSLDQILAQGTGTPPIIPPVRPIPGLKPSAPVIPEPDYAAEATQAGVVFNGMQENVEGKPPIPVFTDPFTKSTFTLPEGETIPDALAKTREKFQTAQGTPPISTATMPPAGELPPETGLPPSGEGIVEPGATSGGKQPLEMTTKRAIIPPVTKKPGTGEIPAKEPPTPEAGKIYYSGTHEGKPTGKYLHLTENPEYAKNFGEDVRQFSTSPEKTLDVTVQGEKVVSFEFLRKILKKEGVEITESMREKYDDIHKPIWQWIRKYPDMAEAIKSAGYDSIKQVETFTGKGKKETTLVILDQSKVKAIPPETTPKAVGGNPFKDSVVQEPVYHGLILREGEKDFSTWDITQRKEIREHHIPEPGIHFGEEDAALSRVHKIQDAVSDWEDSYQYKTFGNKNKRIAGTRPYTYYAEGTVIKEVYLDIKSPIRLVDETKHSVGYGWSWNGILRRLIDERRIPKNKITTDEEIAEAEVRNYFKQNKIDGIVYKNDFESGAGDSYIVFDPKQIKIIRSIVKDADGNDILLPDKFKESLPKPSRPPEKGGQVAPAAKPIPVRTAKPEEKATTTPKEQKNYLVEKIDEALKIAPDEVKVAEIKGVQVENPEYRDQYHYIQEDAGEGKGYNYFQRKIDLANTPTVTIDVPGDGSFTIINDKPHLQEFKKMAGKFPVSEKKPSIIPKPRMEPTGKRIAQEGVEYYNEFKPRKQELITSPLDKGVPGQTRNYYDARVGWYSDGKYAIKTEKPAGLKYADKPVDIKRITPTNNTIPAKIVGEFHTGAGDATREVPQVHIVAEDGGELTASAAYVDAVLTKYPNAKVFLQESTRDTAPILFKDKGKPVAVVMPIRGAFDKERFADRIAEVAREKGVSLSPQEKETPSGAADVGGYADLGRTEPPKPKTEAERNAYIANPRIYLELPEIVEFANRALEGKFPQVRRFMGMALGRFYPGSGKIKIINNMDLDTLAKVLAHEIGHLADWLPDKDMAKGNILGRIGSIPSYLKSLLEEYPGAPGKVLTEKDRERLRREAERQIKGDMSDEDIVTYITRTVPKYEEVGVTPDMILNLLKGLTNEPKNVLDFLKSIDGKVKAEIAKQAMKNLVDERLKLMMGRRIIGTETITEEVRRKRETESERVAARYSELLRKEIEKRRLYQREVISRELKDLTQKWKPFTPGEDSYTKYRLSSKELYADAVSVLFNDPELLRQTAPTFWKAFFNYFEAKPELKAIYDELQARRANPDEVLEQRRRFTRGMAEEGAQIRARNAELLKSRNTLTPSKLWHAFRMALGDQNIRAQEFMEAARKAGKAVADKDRIDYWVEELPYINSEVYGFRTGIEKDILAPAAEAGIGLVDLHEYMILRRAATERAGIYNPGGIGDRFADQQLDFMRQKLGDEKFGKVKELVEKFQAEYRRQVTEVAAEADFLPADLVKTMMENPNYATFANLEYMIEQHMGKGTSARIYKQYGMLGKVDNVFVQTVLKGMALIRAARHHQTKMALIQSPDVGTVVRARRGHKGVGWQKPKDPDMGTIVVSPGGQPQAYYIDKELAQLWEHNEDKANAVTAVGMQGLRLIKGILSRIFIAWNPGWIVANPPRDFWATWKKVQEAHGSLAKGIAATFADAVQAGTGKFPERERRMLAERKILPARFFNEPGSFDAMEREFLAGINDPVVYQNKVLAPFLKAAHWLSENKNWFIVPRITQGLEVLGKIGERWGKFAADEAIRLQAEKKGLPIPEKRAAHLVRTRAGTPNSLSQGTLYRLTETFFPFSNVAAQDLRSSLEAFRESKGTYAYKTFLLNVLPKLIFAAMIAGYFGDDIKKAAGKVGKYFRRMYINFPIAVLKDGNAVNITIPQDYTGQTVSALTDSVLSGDWSGSMGTLGILFENQPYNFNPIISSFSDWVNYYALNQRPNDSFTGYPTMPQDVADVGGKRALAHMTRQTWNRFFGTMLYRVQADKVDQVESELKTWLGAAPFNAIGRFIRITNTGDVERDMQTVSDVAREEKEARLNLREAKVRDINARAGQAAAKDIMTLYRQAVEAGDIDPIATSPSAFAKSYKEMALSREKNTFVQAMTRAATDREKAALLLRWKAEMPDKEYEDLRKYLRENGLTGPGVGVQMLLESQREKYPGRKSVPELLKKARGQ